MMATITAKKDKEGDSEKDENNCDGGCRSRGCYDRRALP